MVPEGSEGPQTLLHEKLPGSLWTAGTAPVHTDNLLYGRREEEYKNMAILLAFWSFYRIIAGTQGPCGSRSGLRSFQKENQDSKQLT